MVVGGRARAARTRSAAVAAVAVIGGERRSRLLRRCSHHHLFVVIVAGDAIITLLQLDCESGVAGRESAGGDTLKVSGAARASANALQRGSVHHGLFVRV